MRTKRAGCAGTKRPQRRPAGTDARDLLQEATGAELKLHPGLLNVRPYPAPGEAESGLRLCRSALNRCPAERKREREGQINPDLSGRPENQSEKVRVGA